MKISLIRILTLGLLLFNSSFLAQVPIDSELEVLRERYNKTIQAHEFEPKIGIPIYEELAPQFEKKQDWIYYYKCLIEAAWGYDFIGDNQKSVKVIEAVIKDYQDRKLDNYYQVKLGDVYLNYGNILSNGDQFDAAITSFNQALDIYGSLKEGENGFEIKEKLMAYSNNNLSKEYGRKREYETALKYIEKAIILKTKSLGGNHKSTLRSIRSRAEIYIELGYYNQALDILKQLAGEFEKGNMAQELAKTQRGISSVYQRKKDFKTAEEYIRKSISIYDTLGSQNLNNKVYSLHQMGNVLKDGGDYQESIPWFEEAIALKNKISGIPNYSAGISTLNIGKAYAYLGQYEKSLKVYQQATEIFDQVLDKNHPKYISLWMSMGNCYLKDGQVTEAHNLFEQSYKLAKEVTVENSYDRVLSCLNLAKTTQDLDQALMFCQEGFGELSADFDYQNVADNPQPEDVFSEFHMLLLLEEKAAIFHKKYQRSNDEKDLVLAMETYQVASGLVDYARQSFFTESAKQYLAEHARGIYESGTQVAFELFEKTHNNIFTEVAFQMMEKSRSLILLEALQTEAAAKIAKIPDSLSFKRNEFRRQLLDLETQFSQLPREDNKTQDLNNKIFAVKQEQELFNEELMKNYPTISRIQNELDLLSIADIQAHLLKEETLLEFLITEEGLFVLKISDENVGFFKRPNNNDLEIKTLDFIGLVNDNQLASKQGAGQEVFQKFTEQSTELYQNILAFALDGSEQKLILIPDSYLNYLPYELLLTNNDFGKSEINYVDLPYLFVENSLRYSFSANLQFQKFIPAKHNHEVLAFAPKYEGKSNPILASRDGFTSLSQTSKEVESIVGMLNGISRIGSTANEKSFKSLASDYGILHLAMHAYTNEENPMLSGLIFSENEDEEDDVLHAYELYGMKLNAQLAVLSACNTGSGKFEKGEGVMSLARGFRQAGVPNIVMSLWQADDESTRTIMESFYTYLKDGTKTDEALRYAKLDYLKGNYKTFPHYWSAFVLMGNDDTIEFVQPTNYLLWGFVGVLLFGLFFYFNKK
ncbi:MAG: CHAT domain-containing protein [Saprospiraceae bacterium]